MCLTLNSLGIQTCAEDTRSSWQISNCSSPDAEVRIHPFGWYQKPGKWYRVHGLSDWFLHIKVYFLVSIYRSFNFQMKDPFARTINKCDRQVTARDRKVQPNLHFNYEGI